MRENKAHYAPSFAVGQPLAGGAVLLVRVSKAEGGRVGGWVGRGRGSGRYPLH
jgi:hypothetical protein